MDDSKNITGLVQEVQVSGDSAPASGAGHAGPAHIQLQTGAGGTRNPVGKHSSEGFKPVLKRNTLKRTLDDDDPQKMRPQKMRRTGSQALVRTTRKPNSLKRMRKHSAPWLLRSPAGFPNADTLQHSHPTADVETDWASSDHVTVTTHISPFYVAETPHTEIEDEEL